MIPFKIKLSFRKWAVSFLETTSATLNIHDKPCISINIQKWRIKLIEFWKLLTFQDHIEDYKKFQKMDFQQSWFSDLDYFQEQFFPNPCKIFSWNFQDYLLLQNGKFLSDSEMSYVQVLKALQYLAPIDPIVYSKLHYLFVSFHNIHFHKLHGKQINKWIWQMFLRQQTLWLPGTVINK